MPLFTVSETQIVEYYVTFEAENEAQAKEMFLNGETPSGHSNVVDSHSLTVREA